MEQLEMETEEKKQVSAKELDDLLAELSAKEKEKDEHAEKGTVINKEYSRLLFRAQVFIKELGRTDYVGPAGKVEIKESWRVNLPKTDQDKVVFFDYLRERGIFDKLATVNSNSLNALYRAEWEEAKGRGEGMTFAMPGIPAPEFDSLPKFTATKEKKAKKPKA